MMTVLRAALAASATLLGGCATFTGPANVEITPKETLLEPLDFERAERLRAAEDYVQAVVAYRSVLNAEPDRAEARYGLAESLRRSGETDAATSEYLRLTEDPVWRARAFEGLGFVQLVGGDHNAAFEAFSTAVETDGAAWRAWIGLAQLRDLARDWERSDEAYMAALAVSDEPATVVNNHGVSMLARGRPEEAAALFRRALELDPASEKASTNLELALAADGKSPEGVARSETDARRRAQKLNNFGYVAMLNGRYADAERFFEEAITAHPAFYATAYENLKVLKSLQAAEPGRR